jgi:hypothetical protein
MHVLLEKFLLMKFIAAKLASSEWPLADGLEEIGNITDFSDDEEKDMCVIFTLILLLTIGSPISDSVEYLLALQQSHRKCETNSA